MFSESRISKSLKRAFEEYEIHTRKEKIKKTINSIYELESDTSTI